MNVLGNNIRKRRLELHMTQEELAKKLGYKGKTAICNVESGDNNMPIDKLELYAIALNTTIEYLLGLKSPKNIIATAPPILQKYSILTQQDKLKVDGYIDGLLASDHYTNKKEVTMS